MPELKPKLSSKLEEVAEQRGAAPEELLNLIVEWALPILEMKHDD